MSEFQWCCLLYSDLTHTAGVRSSVIQLQYHFFSIFNSKGATWSWDSVQSAHVIFVSSFYIQVFNSVWSEMINFFTIILLDDRLVIWHPSHQSLIRFFFLWNIKSLPAASHSYLCCLFRFILSLFCWRIGMHWVTGEFFKPAFIYCIFALLHQSPKTWSD